MFLIHVFCCNTCILIHLLQQIHYFVLFFGEINVNVTRFVIFMFLMCFLGLRIQWRSINSWSFGYLIREYWYSLGGFLHALYLFVKLSAWIAFSFIVIRTLGFQVSTINFVCLCLFISIHHCVYGCMMHV